MRLPIAVLIGSALAVVCVTHRYINVNKALHVTTRGLCCELLSWEAATSLQLYLRLHIVVILGI